MKYILYLLSAVLLLTGCEKSAEVPSPPGDGLVRIIVNPPTVTSKSYSAMKENSTIRLFIYKSDALMTEYPEGNPFKEVTLRVLPGSTTTALCQVDKNGDWTGVDITDEALALPPGKYSIYAISPAIELPLSTPDQYSYNVPGYELKHGSEISLLTTDQKWVEIAYDSPELTTNGTPGYFTLKLNPFRRLTSQIVFTLKRDNNVTDLEITPQGIELNNLNPDAFRPNFYLGEDELIDLGGDYKSSIQITQFSYDPAEDHGRGVYRGAVEVIPGPATDVDLRFHLKVNGGNYKPFLYTLYGRNFVRGMSYHYEITVQVGGIFVNGWTSIDWETIIEN